MAEPPTFLPARGDERSDHPSQGTGSLLLTAFRKFGLALMLAVLLSAVLLSDRTVEKAGDNVQLAVPLTGLACAVASGQGVEYFGRFLLLFSIYTSSKRGLGEVPINERPNGGYAGFPSGHMSATSYGAAWLINSCLSGNRLAQGVTVLAAGFVGGTRIEAGAHNVWQVLVGALLGWMLQFLALRWFDRGLRRVWTGAGRMIGAAGRFAAMLARRVVRRGGRAQRNR